MKKERAKIKVLKPGKDPEKRWWRISMNTSTNGLQLHPFQEQWLKTHPWSTSQKLWVLCVRRDWADCGSKDESHLQMKNPCVVILVIVPETQNIAALWAWYHVLSKGAFHGDMPKQNQFLKFVRGCQKNVESLKYHKPNTGERAGSGVQNPQPSGTKNMHTSLITEKQSTYHRKTI